MEVKELVKKLKELCDKRYALFEKLNTENSYKKFLKEIGKSENEIPSNIACSDSDKKLLARYNAIIGKYSEFFIFKANEVIETLKEALKSEGFEYKEDFEEVEHVKYTKEYFEETTDVDYIVCNAFLKGKNGKKIDLFKFTGESSDECMYLLLLHADNYNINLLNENLIPFNKVVVQDLKLPKVQQALWLMVENKISEKLICLENDRLTKIAKVNNEYKQTLDSIASILK